MVDKAWENKMKELGIPAKGEVHMYTTRHGYIWVMMPINSCKYEQFEGAPDSWEVEGRRVYKRSYSHDGVMYTDSQSPVFAATPWETWLEKAVKWMRSTFTDATPDTVLKKAKEEFAELMESHFMDDEENTQSEVADVILCLIDYCAVKGWDPEKVITHKLQVNQARTWNRPNEEGIVKHA